jgi:hypothetical protein
MPMGDSGQCLEGARENHSLLDDMADSDPELERLLKAERVAFERYERLRGYPGEVQAVALASLLQAREAVRDYRSKHP